MKKPTRKQQKISKRNISREPHRESYRPLEPIRSSRVNPKVEIGTDAIVPDARYRSKRVF